MDAKMLLASDLNADDFIDLDIGHLDIVVI